MTRCPTHAVEAGLQFYCLTIQCDIWLQDLVQRLESITIHWTRQIKEVVNQQVSSMLTFMTCGILHMRCRLLAVWHSVTSCQHRLMRPQDQDDAAERAGPIAEIEFWRALSVDLGGIRDQLDDKSVLL